MYKNNKSNKESKDKATNATSNPRKVVQTREQGWNNRFGMGKIQEYNAYQDKYFISMKLNQEHLKKFEHSKNEGNPYSPDKIKDKDQDSRQSQHQKTANTHIYNNDTASIEDYNNNNNNIETVKSIQFLWNDLGVVEDFRFLFSLVADQLDDTNKMIFLKNELDALEYFSNLLELITNCIQDRTNLIQSIRKTDTDVGHMLKNPSYQIDESLFTELNAKLQQIRQTTITIVQTMMKIRENCAYNILGGKYDLTRLSKRYHFDKNYLIKMKDQLDFLKTSHLKNFYDFIDGDPFLLQPSEQRTQTDRTIPITEDINDDINKCKYYILIDMIYFQFGSTVKGSLFKDMKEKQSELMSMNKPQPQSSLSNTRSMSGLNNKLPQISLMQKNMPTSPMNTNSVDFSVLGRTEQLQKNTSYRSLLMNSVDMQNRSSEKRSQMLNKDKDKDKGSSHSTTNIAIGKRHYNLKPVAIRKEAPKTDSISLKGTIENNNQQLPQPQGDQEQMNQQKVDKPKSFSSDNNKDKDKSNAIDDKQDNKKSNRNKDKDKDSKEGYNNSKDLKLYIKEKKEENSKEKGILSPSHSNTNSNKSNTKQILFSSLVKPKEGNGNRKDSDKSKSNKRDSIKNSKHSDTNSNKNKDIKDLSQKSLQDNNSNNNKDKEQIDIKLNQGDVASEPENKDNNNINNANEPISQNQPQIDNSNDSKQQKEGITIKPPQIDCKEQSGVIQTGSNIEVLSQDGNQSNKPKERVSISKMDIIKENGVITQEKDQSISMSMSAIGIGSGTGFGVNGKKFENNQVEKTNDFKFDKNNNNDNDDKDNDSIREEFDSQNQVIKTTQLVLIAKDQQIKEEDEEDNEQIKKNEEALKKEETLIEPIIQKEEAKKEEEAVIDVKKEDQQQQEIKQDKPVEG